MVPKLLITGANGFIGRAVLRVLESNESTSFEVHAIYNKSKPPIRSQLITWHKLDLLSNAAVDKLIESVKPSHLLHLAWYINRTDYWTSPKNLEWVRASLYLAESFFRYGNKMVCTGTSAEYDWSQITCDELKTPRNSKLTYGLAKNALFNLLMAYASSQDKNIAWARIFFAYGSDENPDRLLPKAILSLLNNKPFELTQGHLLQDFTYVDDVAQALLAILQSEVTGGINIGRGLEISQSEMIELIAHKLGKTNLIDIVEKTPEVREGAVAAIDRLTQEVGYTLKTDVDEGLNKYIEWIRESYTNMV